MATPALQQQALIEEIGRRSGELRLPEQDAAVLREMLDAWARRRIGAKRHQPKSVSRDLAVLIDFATFAGSGPWRWREDDFDRWCERLGRHDRLSPATQRHYQGAVRQFLQYLVGNVKFVNDVRRLYGTGLVQICNDDNCIPHVYGRELAQERPAMSHEEIAQLFAAMDEHIVRAHRSGSKDFRPLQRDKLMLSLLYIGGLRISEARGMNTDSFQPNPKVPSFGPHGFMSVWGKGSRGSGPKHRLVPIDHADLPPLIKWYLASVRPWFLRNADANEKALLLSERGARMSLSTMEARFQHAIDLADMDGRGFVPHSLRHSSVSHESHRLSLEANRRKHGHVYAATTQGYTHVEDEYVDDEIARAIDAQIRAAIGDKP